MIKYFKIILVNIFVFVLILFSIELIAFSTLKVYKKKTNHFLINTYPEERRYLNDPCQKMMTHPFLNHIHDHENLCNVKGGKVSGEFVFYFDENIDIKKNEFLMTLGGSTTDGFYNHLSNGETWPFHLSNIIKKNRENLKVLNGGTGGYSSTQELLKLILEVKNLLSTQSSISLSITLHSLALRIE